MTEHTFLRWIAATVYAGGVSIAYGGLIPSPWSAHNIVAAVAVASLVWLLVSAAYKRLLE